MMKVLGDRVLVALPPKVSEQEETTGFTYRGGQVSKGGIILAKETDAYDVEVATRGIVVQLGQQDRRIALDAAIDALENCMDYLDAEIRALTALTPAPFDVQVGDCVIFPPNVGEQLDQDGISYLILRESDIVGILEPSGREDEWLEQLIEAAQSARKVSV
jgi:co-chaperonin GroES (HSP10)